MAVTADSSTVVAVCVSASCTHVSASVHSSSPTTEKRESQNFSDVTTNILNHNCKHPINCDCFLS